MKTTHYRIIVSPADILALNTAPICTLLNPNEASAPARLRAMQGNVMIILDEFRFRGKRDSRNLYEIPEIRAFCAKLKNDCPYWFYFLPLDVASLWLCTASTLNALVIEKRKGAKTKRVHFNRDELVSFFESLAPATEEICALAGQGGDFYLGLMERVAKYYANIRFTESRPHRLLA